MERYQDISETKDSVARRQMSFSRWRLWFITVLALKSASLKFSSFGILDVTREKKKTSLGFVLGSHQK